MPDSMPAGIFTSILFSLFTLPSPLQFLHGVFTISPSPWQFEQVLDMLKNPVLVVTLPEPPHCGHVVLDVPGLIPLPLQASQPSYLKTLTVRFMPKQRL